MRPRVSRQNGHVRQVLLFDAVEEEDASTVAPRDAPRGSGVGDEVPVMPKKDGVTASSLDVDGLREAMSRLGAVSLRDVRSAPPPPLLVGRLDPFGHTLLFGPGGIGKGALASIWIVCAVRAGHRVLILDYENQR